MATFKAIINMITKQYKKIEATKPLNRLAKELNLAICCLLGSPATDATINLHCKCKENIR